MKLQNQFKGDFKFRSPDVSPSDWLTIYEFSYIATNVPLRGINLLNKSEINVSPCYKLVSFDTVDLKLLTAVYRMLYFEGRIYINLARLKYGYLRMGPKYKQEDTSTLASKE